MKLAKIYEKDRLLFPVKVLQVSGHTYLIESNVAHGNRKQVYVVISPSNGRYVIVHRTKNKRVCNLSGHDGEKCEHTALLPKVFMNERYEQESDYDSDDAIGLTEILEKLEKTNDVPPIEEV